MVRILVTGGAGFIGSAFVRRSVQAGVQVVNLDALTYASSLASLNEVQGRPEHTFVHGDICDRALVDRLILENRPVAIVNFAAESHVDRSIDRSADFIRTNVMGTHVLLESALAYWSKADAELKERFRFIHVSTDEVFGSLGPTGAFTEETAYSPRSPYSASKASSDHLVRAWNHTFGLPTIVTNCTNNYGPYQLPEKLIPLLTVSALTGRPLPIYGKGENVRDWLHVDDHCSALTAAMTRGRPGETYCIGGGNERTNIEVVRGICAVLDELAPRADGQSHTAAMTFVKDRPGHDFRYAMDSSKIQAELGWRPAFGFEEGLKQTIAWYLKNREWWQASAKGGAVLERQGQIARAKSGADAVGT